MLCNNVLKIQYSLLILSYHKRKTFSEQRILKTILQGSNILASLGHTPHIKYTKKPHNVLSEVTIVCWAAFTAIPHCMWPRRDTPEKDRISKQTMRSLLGCQGHLLLLPLLLPHFSHFSLWTRENRPTEQSQATEGISESLTL